MIVANDTSYGLTNYSQATEENRARRVARQLCSSLVEMKGKFGAMDHHFAA